LRLTRGHVGKRITSASRLADPWQRQPWLTAGAEHGDHTGDQEQKTCRDRHQPCIDATPAARSR
jgi:hypothetical protein